MACLLDTDYRTGWYRVVDLAADTDRFRLALECLKADDNCAEGSSTETTALNSGWVSTSTEKTSGWIDWLYLDSSNYYTLEFLDYSDLAWETIPWTCCSSLEIRKLRNCYARRADQWEVVYGKFLVLFSVICAFSVYLSLIFLSFLLLLIWIVQPVNIQWNEEKISERYMKNYSWGIWTQKALGIGISCFQ